MIRAKDRQSTYIFICNLNKNFRYKIRTFSLVLSYGAWTDHRCIQSWIPRQRIEGRSSCKFPSYSFAAQAHYLRLLPGSRGKQWWGEKVFCIPRRIHEEEPDDEFLIDSCEDLEQNPDSLSLCDCVAVPSHEPIGVPGLRGRPYRNRRITGLALTSHLLSTPTSKLRHSDVVMGGLDGFISKIAIVPLYLKMRNMMKTREMA